MSANLIEHNQKPSPVSSICESCGRDFSCGAQVKNCWCFDTKLSPQTLAEINGKYSKCLCPVCLVDAKRATPLAPKNS